MKVHKEAVSFKCGNCGRFVSLQDLSDGSATNIFITPDSACSHEEFELTCKNCLKKK